MSNYKMGTTFMSNKLSPARALSEAKHLATTFHSGMSYGTKEYTFHLAQVSKYIMQVNSIEDVRAVNKETGWDEEYTVLQICLLLRAGCWLHDILEDTDCTEDLLVEKGFPEVVIDMVVSMTKLPEETHEMYMERLCKNPWAIFGKKADSFANLQNSLLNGRTKGVVKYTKNLHTLHFKFLSRNKDAS